MPIPQPTDSYDTIPHENVKTDNTKQLLSELIELAEQWRDAVREYQSEILGKYADGFVECYFASESGYTSARFGVWPMKFEVSFMQSPTIEFGFLGLDRLPEILVKARKELDVFKSDKTKEKVDKKALRRQHLLNELAGLDESNKEDVS